MPNSQETPVVTSGVRPPLDLTLERLGPVAAAVAVVSYLVVQVYDLDIWWQVAIGRDILQTGAVPIVDRYAVAALGRPYHDSHWLFQIAAALADHAGGMFGVQLLMIGLWSAALLVVYRHTRRFVPPFPAAILLFLGSMACIERFLPRPEIVTYLMVAAFSWLLAEPDRPSARTMVGVTLLQVLWTNAHGLFVLGPAIVACHACTALSGGRWRDRPRMQAWMGLAGLTVAGTLASPHGVEGWRYAALLARESRGQGARVFESLGELSPTFGEAFRQSPAFWAYVVLVAAVGGVLVAGIARRRLSAEALVAALMLGLSLTGRRNVALLGIVASPVLGWALTHTGWAWRAAGRWVSVAWVGGMLLASSFAVSGAYYVHMEIPSRFGLGATPSFFPHAWPRVLAETGFSGTVLSSNTLGGFVLYHGFPRMLPVTDGRWEAYEPEILDAALRGTRSPGRWRDVAVHYNVRGILVAHTSPEARILPELVVAGEWRLVFLDTAASFWLPGRGLGLKEIDPNDPRFLPPVERIEDAVLLNAFLARVRADEARLVHLRRSLELGWRREFLLSELGTLQVQMARFEDAEQTFRELSMRDPRNLTALNEMAFLTYRRGEFGEALEYLERALKESPENGEIQQNMTRVREAIERARLSKAP